MSEVNATGDLTPEERQQLADEVCEKVRAWFDNPANRVHVEMNAGTETRECWETQGYKTRYNNTYTLTVSVNGGAQDTTGPPITGDDDAD